ncbi:MAG: hypothetical protein AB8V23_04555 [Candidatus Midichloria sp.]
MPYLGTYITNILNIAVELLDETYRLIGNIHRTRKYSEGELEAMPARLNFEL